MNSDKIAVVTGANGFVGSHLVDHLLMKGYLVRCIVRKSSNLRWLENKQVEIHDCGLFDKSGLDIALSGAHYLFHVAGVVKSKKRDGYFKGNVETTRNLLETLVKINPGIEKVVIVSSQTAVGPSPSEKPVNEDSPCAPITNYGKSKREQELLALKYREKLPITIVRPPAIYGERDTEIFLMFKTYKQGLMTLVGFDKKMVSLVNVKDLVNGIFLAAVSDNSAGEIYHISSEKFYTWLQMGKAFSKAFGKKALTSRLPHFLVYTVAVFAQFFSMFSSQAATFNIEKARDFVQKYWTLDTSKAVRDLGYHQSIPIEEGIKETARWYLDNKWL